MAKKPKATHAPTAEPRIVSAVGVSAHSIDNPALAAKVEQAMAQAVTDCLAAGVSINDSQAIKAAILKARQRVRREAGLPDDD